MLIRIVYILLLFAGQAVVAGSVLAQPKYDAKRLVRHGTLPVDPDYWRFNRWYQNHSVLDVYVNGRNPKHLATVLRELEELKKRRVLIRDITVIGGYNFAQLDRGTRSNSDASQLSAAGAREILLRSGIDPALAGIADRLDLSDGQAVSGIEKKLQTLEVEHSPSWVVSYQGKRYVYSGAMSMTKHFARNGAFRGGEETIERQNSGVSLLPESDEKNTEQQYFHVYRYRLGTRRMPPGLGSYDVKPTCSGPNRRRKPVYYDTAELDDFDLTFYDYNDKSSVKQAKQSATPTVPYLEGDLYNPHRDKDDLQQEFGRFFDIRCLPTRVHFIYIGENRVEEYLEGSLAWESKQTTP